jgi:hypothetical protein
MSFWYLMNQYLKAMYTLWSLVKTPTLLPMTPFIVTQPYLIDYVIKISNKMSYEVPLKFMYF